MTAETINFTDSYIRKLEKMDTELINAKIREENATVTDYNFIADVMEFNGAPCMASQARANAKAAKARVKILATILDKKL